MKVKKTVSRKFSERSMISKTFVKYIIEMNVYAKNEKQEKRIKITLNERSKKPDKVIIKLAAERLDPDCVMLDAKIKTAAEVRYLISVDDFIANAVEAK